MSLTKKSTLSVPPPNITSQSLFTDFNYSNSWLRNVAKSLNFSNNIRLVRELICNQGSTCVSYTDDFNNLASGQEDGSILLFDLSSRSKVLIDYETSLHGEPCTDIKIKSSPKNGFHKRILAGYLSGHIKLWDTTIPKVLFTLKENRQLFGLNYHPYSYRFVSVGNDFKVNVYDEEARVTERVLASSGIRGAKNGHTDTVCTALFHPRNPFELISGGIDNTIQIWDMRAPYAIRNIEGICMYGDALDLTYDGKIILCGSSASWDSPLFAYDYSTGKLLRSYVRNGSFVYCCKFLSPVFVGVGGFYHHTFKIINMKTLQVYASISGFAGCVMSFALRRKNLFNKAHSRGTLEMALSAGNKVVEVEIITPDYSFEAVDYYSENTVPKPNTWY